MNFMVFTKNTYFSFAVAEILRTTFGEKVSLGAFKEPTTETITSADVILMSPEPGEQFLCHPCLQYRKSNSKLILRVKDPSDFINWRPPHCLSDAIVIDEKCELERFARLCIKMTNAAGYKQDNRESKISCLHCPCACLGMTQYKVISKFLQGFTISQIAGALGLSEKSIYKEKRQVMTSFKIKSDQELYYLFENIKLTHNLPLIKK